MEFEIITETGEKIELLTVLPNELRQYKIFSTINAFVTTFGIISIQIFKGNGFSIIFNDYLIKLPASFYKRSSSPLLMLHLSFQNNSLLDIEGIGKLNLKEGQFNLTYLPFVNTKLHLKSGEHKFFCIQYTKEYLSKFTRYLPALELFLKNVDDKKPVVLSSVNLYATDKMMRVMKDILDAKDQIELDEFSIETKARELLVAAMIRMKGKNGKAIRLRENEVETIEAIHEWIKNNIENYGSVRSVAKNFGLNINKISSGFKQLYGLTVIEYISELRMEKAYQLLKETDKPIGDISQELGYATEGNFTRAFKKYYGFKPISLRKTK
jgi:AraC-like DNA-binding protein